jgi:nitrate/TMAO reductase-like tetraheme cytochrome c subunit
VRLRTRIIAHPIIAAVLVLAFVGVAAAAVPVFRATETPSFCTTCHEMQPYYDAWSVGAHKGISCVECHVDAGTVKHVEHKVTAAKELWDHFSSDPRFPQGTADVPNSRCLNCHADIVLKTGPKFSHKQHAGAGPCVECHSDAGHRVTLASLAKADILKPGLETSGAAIVVAAVGTGAAGAATHTPVSCARCHDLTKVACPKCHQPAHEARGDCVACHQPGPRWSFSHPSSGDCASCHEAPAKHFVTACASCHSPGVPFAQAVYKHSSKACANCHEAPANHRSGACASCHTKAGASWAFTHPNKSSCASCHAAPGGHNRKVGCGSCHRIGVPFKQGSYRHTSSSCASCHRAPSGHVRTVSCATCHRRRGVSWAASHPASARCASCHKAPASHFGTSCSSCHKPLVSWSRATFNHPRAGEHSYRSFACVKCHPSGYTSHNCTCHGGRPPKGD